MLGDTGEDDFLVTELLRMDKRSAAPRLARLVSRVFHHHDANGIYAEDDSEAAEHRLWELSDIHSRSDCNLSSYDLKALYFLSINYILGVGCLGVP